MAIVNRTLDASEQRKVLEVKNGATATGVTLTVGLVPWPGVIQAAQMAAFGLSGAPSYQLTIERFIVGTGATSIIFATGTSNTPPAFGTSGLPTTGMKIAASGSTLLNVQAGDVIMALSGASNAAATGVAISVVIDPSQDIKTYFGLI